MLEQPEESAEVQIADHCISSAKSSGSISSSESTSVNALSIPLSTFSEIDSVPLC